MNIFDELDNIIKSTSKHLNESESTHDDFDEVDPNYSTAKQGVDAAVQQIVDRFFSGGDEDEPSGGGGGTEMGEVDDPLDSLDDKKGGDGVDKTFRSTKMDDMDDLEKLDGDDVEKDEDSSLEDEDFEFDDFDYDSKPSGGGSDDEDDEPTEGSGMSSEYDDYDDGDFDDEELGDEGDYDFGGEGDDGYDGPDGDYDDDDYEEVETGEEGRSSSGSFGSKSKGSSGSSGSRSSESSGGSDDEDVDYDDTLDYDSKNFDSLESEIEDALERTKEGTSSKHEKEKLDKMKKDFSGESDESDGGEGEKSDSERAEELDKDIKDATSDEKTGSGELAGESLDETPSDKDFEEDMSKAGFDKKDIDDMKKSKDTDLSGEIDDEKIAKEAMEEMDKKAKERGESSSSLSRTIMSTILKGKLSNMEWKEILGTFLKTKSKMTGGSFAKSRSTSWGDKKHLWRDAIMPKSTPSGGDLDEINCFIDFSGSVSQPLVFSFLHRVLMFCGKLTFNKVNVYGFAATLSTPYTFKKRDIPKDEKKFEEYLKDMWKFIDKQGLDGSIENFEAVAKEIVKLKKKDHDTPILIFGDGLWGVSYNNPKPPMYLNELCKRYLKDILCLVYYEKDDYYTEVLKKEVAYLKEIVGIKNVITTEIESLT